LVIAGLDPVAVDAVGASVMGIEPNKVKHLIFAEKKGLGTIDLDQIEILGEQIKNVQKKFKRSALSKFLVHLGWYFIIKWYLPGPILFIACFLD